jgi:hypothetical protein
MKHFSLDIRLLIGLIMIVVTGILLFLIYLWPFIYIRIDREIMENNSLRTVIDDSDFVSFTPVGKYDNVMIFYPGAFVDPVAYAPICSRLAEQGTKTIIVKMPLRSAVLGYEKILRIGLLEEPDKEYTIAGHSHGASMALKFIRKHPEYFSKIILLASRYPQLKSLADHRIKALKIYGSEDKIEKPEKVEAGKHLLPASAKYVKINGANHAQFGWYSKQYFDGEASISLEDQQEIILKEMHHFIYFETEER